MYSTPQHLKRLQILGYKTFSPYIDESYDLIENNKERFYAIVNEIDRINKSLAEQTKLREEDAKKFAEEDKKRREEYFKTR